MNRSIYVNLFCFSLAAWALLVNNILCASFGFNSFLSQNILVLVFNYLF